MASELYLKIDQKISTGKKKILISDIASIHHTNMDIQKAIGEIMVLKIDSNEQGIYVITTLKVIELIHRKYPDMTIVNEGETDFIINYIPTDEQKVSGKEAKNKVVEYSKAAFVTLVSFVGAAFTIMTFNLDVDVKGLFEDVYEWFMGVEKGAGPTILEFSYCLGLPLGIVLFFNHFSRKKLTSDPTPIHVEMRNYEKQINQAYIEDASREGKTIDVS